MKYFGLLANPRRCLAGRIRGHRMRETRENWGLAGQSQWICRGLQTRPECLAHPKSIVI